MGWLQTDEFKEPEEKPKAVFAIDFDATIVEDAFPSIGNPNPGAIEVMRELMAKGYRLILNTLRTDDMLNQALVYCNKNYIDFWGVNENPDQKDWNDARKIHANVYIDDKGAGTPLKVGSNGKPCVDWAKLRELFVEWEILDPLDEPDNGTKTFNIK